MHIFTAQPFLEEAVKIILDAPLEKLTPLTWSQSPLSISVTMVSLNPRTFIPAWLDMVSA